LLGPVAALGQSSAATQRCDEIARDQLRLALARHQAVRVELLEGIVAANGRPFERWAFVFSTRD
jgi:hypothetical protein